MPVLPDHASLFARIWYAAWNTHDVERIVSRCEPDVEYASPLIGVVGLRADERIAGVDAVRSFVELAFDRFPGLYMRPRLLFVGADGVTLHYRILGGLLVSETLELTDDRRVCRVSAHYASVLESELSMPTADVTAGGAATDAGPAFPHTRVALHGAPRSGERRPGCMR